MSEISRFNGNYQAFGINATAGERTVFNDQATESDTLDDNITSDYLRGLGINAVGSKPIRESIAGAIFVPAQTLAYLHQKGIAEWNSSQEYYTNSFCNRSGYIFRSESGPNIGNDPLTDSTNWKLVSPGEYVGRRLNINGSCDVWQLGTSFTAPSNGIMLCDCFFNQNTVTGLVHNASRSTNISTTTIGYSLMTEVTTGATPGAAEYSGIVIRPEGQLLRNVKDQSVTLSFLIYATVTGTYSVAISNYGNDRTYVSEYTVNTSEAWERKTVTFTVDSTSGTWDFDNNAGLRIRFVRSSGSSVQTATLDTWQSGDYWGSTNQVNNDETIGNLFGIDDVQLESGIVATSYEHRLDDAEKCLRYIYPITDGRGIIGSGWTDTTNQAYIKVPLVQMRTNNPSIASTGGSTVYRINADPSDGNPTVTLDDAVIISNGLELNIGCSGAVTAERTCAVYQDSVSDVTYLNANVS